MLDAMEKRDKARELKRKLEKASAAPAAKKPLKRLREKTKLALVY